MPALLDRLRERGIAISLDDFGTGYSSLGYLGRMPVDEIKIDRKFVMELSEGGASEAVVRAILALARGLGKSVLAEGVETTQQARLLAELGCDFRSGLSVWPPDGRSGVRRARRRTICLADRQGGLSRRRGLPATAAARSTRPMSPEEITPACSIATG